MMASQTHKMAAWTLVVMLLCAQFEVRESVKQSCVQRFKNLLNWKKASNCDAECTECGKQDDPSKYMIVIALKFKPKEFGFATVIGKRIALTNRFTVWSRIVSLENFAVFFLNNGKLTNSAAHEITSIEKSQKKNGDPIALVVLNKDIPQDMKPACLPTSELDIELGMKFDVPFYKKAKSVNDITKLTNRKLKIFGVEDVNGRLCSLDDDRANKESGLRVAISGGSAVLKVNYRNVMFGLLAFLSPNTNNLDPRIVPIDDEGVVKWIRKVAGNNCACEVPKAEVPPNNRHSS